MKDFLDALLADPLNKSKRMMFADHLEDIGDERAEMVRTVSRILIQKTLVNIFGIHLSVFFPKRVNCLLRFIIVLSTCLVT